jgi:hypothetical protein
VNYYFLQSELACENSLFTPSPFLNRDSGLCVLQDSGLGNFNQSFEPKSFSWRALRFPWAEVAYAISLRTERGLLARMTCSFFSQVLEGV